MGDFLLRKCDVAGREKRTAGEEGTPLVHPATNPGSAGPAAASKRRILDGFQDSSYTGPTEHGFLVKRSRSGTSSPPVSSSGYGGPDRSVVEHCVVSSGYNSSDSSSSAAPATGHRQAEPEEENEDDHRLGVAAVSADGGGGGGQGKGQDEKERLRLGRRPRLGVAVSAKHSGGGVGSKFWSSSETLPPHSASSSSSSGLEDVPPQVAVEFGELESTAGSSVPGSWSASPTSGTPSGGAAAVSSAAAPPYDEIEEFFAQVEGDLRKKFAEKYNYDVMKDSPLEGRYEWVRIKR